MGAIVLFFEAWADGHAKHAHTDVWARDFARFAAFTPWNAYLVVKALRKVFGDADKVDGIYASMGAALAKLAPFAEKYGCAYELRGYHGEPIADVDALADLVYRLFHVACVDKRLPDHVVHRIACAFGGTSVRRTRDMPLLIKGCGRLGEDVLHPFLRGGRDYKDLVAPLFYRHEVRSHGIVLIVGVLHESVVLRAQQRGGPTPNAFFFPYCHGDTSLAGVRELGDDLRAALAKWPSYLRKLHAVLVDYGVVSLEKSPEQQMKVVRGILEHFELGVAAVGKSLTFAFLDTATMEVIAPSESLDDIKGWTDELDVARKLAELCGRKSVAEVVKSLKPASFEDGVGRVCAKIFSVRSKIGSELSKIYVPAALVAGADLDKGLLRRDTDVHSRLARLDLALRQLAGRGAARRALAVATTARRAADREVVVAAAAARRERDDDAAGVGPPSKKGKTGATKEDWPMPGPLPTGSPDHYSWYTWGVMTACLPDHPW